MKKSTKQMINTINQKRKKLGQEPVKFKNVGKVYKSTKKISDKDKAISKASKLNHRAYFADYIKGFWWRNRRKRYWATHEKICYVCTNTAVELHHNNYTRLYRELDSDLVPLCRSCHQKVHDLIATDNDTTLENAHVVLKYINQIDCDNIKHLESF